MKTLLAELREFLTARRRGPGPIANTVRSFELEVAGDINAEVITASVARSRHRLLCPLRGTTRQPDCWTGSSPMTR